MLKFLPMYELPYSKTWSLLIPGSPNLNHLSYVFVRVYVLSYSLTKGSDSDSH